MRATVSVVATFVAYSELCAPIFHRATSVGDLRTREGVRYTPRGC